ncbi:hypothetical protein BCR43DRAFT_494129 [Syncephalastrum racemosum]|uniref:Uncharacterized protein n=1 Tax=Syncephalastrum racemosum TaxID=13706 RepID=A0A1X2H7H2_SYNRA|nr:hypothetical protein BCR43DRAFT_494129 [Syncephalastrum racemosum]
MPRELPLTFPVWLSESLASGLIPDNTSRARPGHIFTCIRRRPQSVVWIAHDDIPSSRTTAQRILGSLVYI